MMMSWYRDIIIAKLWDMKMENKEWLKFKRIIYEIKINNIKDSFSHCYNIFMRNIDISDLIGCVSFEEISRKTDEIVSCS